MDIFIYFLLTFQVGTDVDKVMDNKTQRLFPRTILLF